MKKALAFVMTILLAGAAVWWSYRQRARTPEEPESAVWRMLDASRNGDRAAVHVGGDRGRARERHAVAEDGIAQCAPMKSTA